MILRGGECGCRDQELELMVNIRNFILYSMVHYQIAFLQLDKCVFWGLSFFKPFQVLAVLYDFIDEMITMRMTE
jgi:hypothetical protein